MGRFETESQYQRTASRRSTMRLPLRKLVFWLHLGAAVSLGLVILLLAATGLLLAFESQILAWADRDSSRIQSPQQSTEPTAVRRPAGRDRGTPARSARDGGDLEARPDRGDGARSRPGGRRLRRPSSTRRHRAGIQLRARGDAHDHRASPLPRRRRRAAAARKVGDRRRQPGLPVRSVVGPVPMGATRARSRSVAQRGVVPRRPPTEGSRSQLAPRSRPVGVGSARAHRRLRAADVLRLGG